VVKQVTVIPLWQNGHQQQNSRLNQAPSCEDVIMREPGTQGAGELNLADKNVACLHVRLHLWERTFLQPVRSGEVCPFADLRIRD
jgi:hypothetical protein